MGAWGIGSFENDDAADWAWRFDEEDGLKLLDETLDSVFGEGSPNDYVEAPTGSEVVAACEVIARMKGKSTDRTIYGEAADKWIAAHGSQPKQELIAKANKALDIVLSDRSELYQLWQESESFVDWQASVADLRQRMNS